MDLSGTWTLQSVDGAHRVAMQVPGDVHSALIAAEIIPHPYKGRNEYDVRWVAEGEWTTRAQLSTGTVRRETGISTSTISTPWPKSSSTAKAC